MPATPSALAGGFQPSWAGLCHLAGRTQDQRRRQPGLRLCPVRAVTVDSGSWPAHWSISLGKFGFRTYKESPEGRNCRCREMWSGLEEQAGQPTRKPTLRGGGKRSVHRCAGQGDGGHSLASCCGRPSCRSRNCADIFLLRRPDVQLLQLLSSLISWDPPGSPRS